MIEYPSIDPALFTINPFMIGSLTLGPFFLRWYSLAYIGGILLGATYIKYLNRRLFQLPNLKPFDDMLLWAIAGIILGGRLGYVIFYQFDYFFSNPLSILKIWEGGMSFHGGLVGFTLSMWYFARVKNYSFLAIMDLCAAAAPIGLFLGRIANFINGELYGRTTDVPWAMIFPHGGPYPRHPSQLYEAFLEGIVSFLIIYLISRLSFVKHYRGVLAGSFLCCYAISRIIVEFFREPDIQLGFIIPHITMGQILCLPMLAVGIITLIYAKRTRINEVQ